MKKEIKISNQDYIKDIDKWSKYLGWTPDRFIKHCIDMEMIRLKKTLQRPLTPEEIKEEQKLAELGMRDYQRQILEDEKN